MGDEEGNAVNGVEGPTDGKDRGTSVGVLVPVNEFIGLSEEGDKVWKMVGSIDGAASIGNADGGMVLGDRDVGGIDGLVEGVCWEG